MFQPGSGAPDTVAGSHLFLTFSPDQQLHESDVDGATWHVVDR
ncbi:MAG: hypothetical protein ABWX73_09740 [Marmoricola sp.]